MKKRKILIISIISVLTLGIIAGIWILFSPNSVIVDIENQEQADSRKEGKNQSKLKELAEGRADTGMEPDDGSDESEQKLQDDSGAGQKIEQSNKMTAENKTEQTTAAADSTPVTTTENKTVSTTEAATERKTEATTEAATRSRTQSTTESTTEAATTAHTHTWKAIYKTVKHEEVGHWEEVEAGQLEHPIEEDHVFCGACNFDYTAAGVAPWTAHFPDGRLAYEYSSDLCVMGTYHDKWVTVGYWYEPFYDDVWVVDRKAYTEQVVDHYECSECGARK